MVDAIWWVVTYGLKIATLRAHYHMAIPMSLQPPCLRNVVKIGSIWISKGKEGNFGKLNSSRDYYKHDNIDR